MPASALFIGASALAASQRALEVASHNVANANNPGYTRQRADLVAAIPTPGNPGRGDGMRGMGVTVTRIERLRDTLADVSYRTQTAAAGDAQARARVLDRAQEVLGPVTAGVPASLNAFWASWDRLSLYPTDTAARQAVISSGADVARGLRSASNQLDQVVSDARVGASGSVDDVNGLSREVARLNSLITEVVASGSQPNDLLDQRDVAVDKLVRLTGAAVHPQDDASVNLLVNGYPLVDGKIATPMSALVGPTGGVALAWPDGSAVAAGGELGGYVSVTSTTIPALRADLDALALGLRDTVNAAYAAGFDANGAQPATTANFFTGSGAASLDVRAGITTADIRASASGAANDGNHALVLAGLRTAPTVGSQSANAAVAALAGRLGAQAHAAAGEDSAAAAALDGVATQRASRHGVNIDEEMVDIVRFQRAYEAAARVISVTDGMLDTIINRMGAGR